MITIGQKKTINEQEIGLPSTRIVNLIIECCLILLKWHFIENFQKSDKNVIVCVRFCLFLKILSKHMFFCAF